MTQPFLRLACVKDMSLFEKALQKLFNCDSAFLLYSLYICPKRSELFYDTFVSALDENYV